MQKLCRATLAANRARKPPISWGRSRHRPKALNSLSYTVSTIWRIEATHRLKSAWTSFSLLGVALGRMDDLGSVAFQPTPMVLFSLEAFVCDVGSREGRARAFEPRVGISPHREEGLGQWLIGRGAPPKTQARDYPEPLHSGKER